MRALKLPKVDLFGLKLPKAQDHPISSVSNLPANYITMYLILHQVPSHIGLGCYSTFRFSKLSCCKMSKLSVSLVTMFFNSDFLLCFSGIV